jgi:hypothetical protein
MGRRTELPPLTVCIGNLGQSLYLLHDSYSYVTRGKESQCIQIR